jgi:predicted transcriptional regulator
MTSYSSREAARKLGISPAVLSKYLKTKKVPAPKTVQIGRLKVQSWTETEVEHLRRLLPKIKNGRKTRHRKEQKPKRQTKPKKK